MKKIKSTHVKIAIIVVIAGAVLYAIMRIIDNIGLFYSSVGDVISFVLGLLAPVLIGFVITFLLSRPSDFFERQFCKIKPVKKSIAHIMGSLVAFLLFIGIIVAFFYLMVPSIIDSVSSVSRDIPGYAKSVDAVLLDWSKNPGLSRVYDFVGIDPAKTDSISAIIGEFWGDITVFLQNLTGSILGFLVDTGLFIYNFVLGVFFSIYMLLFKHELKNQLRVLSQNVFRKSHHKLMFLVDITDDMFYRFLVGKGICSIAVGLITFAVCSILGFKYSPLISIIIAVTNMIPTFGPFIGAIPALLLSLMTAPAYALYMVFIIIGVQVVDGNIVGPRVLGSSMGINGFWIMFSIIVFGALFGVIGMLIAAPVFGVLRILLKNWIFRRNHTSLEGEAEFEASMQRFREWTTKKKKGRRSEESKA
jgi:predicted PurR-regulated permease PerM